MPYPESMSQLIESFARLPGVGIRTAERFAFYVLSAGRAEAMTLSTLINKVNENVHACHVCFNFSDTDQCRICSDTSRDMSLLCVVQEPKDVVAIEKAGTFRGRYHVLMGALSPLEGIGPKDIKIKELLSRLKDSPIQEVILATASDTEGDATALYLSKHIKVPGVKVTRIAHGIPMGSSLEFVDKATLARAIQYRQNPY